MNIPNTKNLYIYIVFVLIFLVAPQINCQAKEIDQFTDRFIVLRNVADGTSIIDAQVNAELDKALRKINQNPRSTEQQRIEIIEDTFQSPVLPDLKTPLEEWVEFDSSIFHYTVLYRGIFGQAVDYDDMGIGDSVGLSPIIRIADIFFGADKIGHFFGQGWKYFTSYREYLTQDSTNQTEESRLDRVREIGHNLEATTLGLVGTGVYSYGDLAANWQGFQFYRSLFGGATPYFQRNTNGTYTKVRQFTFRDYITDDFDEVLNPSRVRTARFFNHVRANFHLGNPSICQQYRSNPQYFMKQSGRRLRWEDYVWASRIDHSALPYFLRIENICRN